MKTFKHLLTSTLIAASTAALAQTTTVIVKTDSTVSTTRKHKSINRVTSDFSVYLGLNNFGGTLPAGYDFRPLGSRFVALSWQKRIPLSVNGATKLRLITGPEVAWNNFMFERSADAGRNILVERNNQLVIEQSDVDLRKSKFVVAQLNLPVMLNVSFRSGFTVGVGAYAGVRLDSYTAVKPISGSAVRDHGSYNLNTVRWGLTSELGFRGTAKLFFRYEPNSPFKAGQGPDASVWAVGVKL